MSLIWQSVLTNVPGFVLGIITSTIMFHSRGSDMAERSSRRFWQGRGFPWFVVAAVLVLFGVQTLQYQRAGNEADADRDAQARCLSQWGADMVSALSARVDANDDLKAAQTRHDDANDSIIGVFIAANAQGNKSSPELRKQFSDALDEFAAAKAALTRTQQTVAKTLRDNTYPPPPTLTCH